MTHRIGFRWLHGPKASIEVAPVETVLEAAERVSVDIPIGHTGAGTCTGRVAAGDVSYRRLPRALNDRHIRDGIVLLYVTEPRTDHRFDIGTAVQTQLV